jgi:hypothetical protein
MSQENKKEDKGFLPEGYEIPKTPSSYVKFEEGDTKFLPLAGVIVGYEYWTVDSKPVRLTEAPTELPANIKRKEDGSPTKVSPFWAFPVWNYEDERVQILELTQKGIMQTIKSLAENPEWESPVMKYSLTVTRVGKGLETEYSTVPNPAKDIPKEITEAWEEVKKNDFDITRLFVSGDPFNKEA